MSTLGNKFVDLLIALENLVAGKQKSFWPSWKCTQGCTQNVVSAKKRLPKGKGVTPLESYSFHTPFSTETDGNQWVIHTYSNHGYYRVLSVILLAISLWFAWIAMRFYLPSGETYYLWMLLPVPFFLFVLYKARTGGENTWIILDRSTGNVCFWKKNEENSLTVPFEQVKCYWVHAYQRGGHSYHFVLMPEVALPNERARWWPTLMGFPLTYQQAQYFWRVLCDFMDPNGTVPEVPGLAHQVRACERLGYTIEDITEGGKTIPEEVFQEVVEEIEREFEELTVELESLLKPKHFNAERLNQFYNQAPVFFKDKALLEIRLVYKRLFIGLNERNQMHPRYSSDFSMEEYKSEVSALGRWLVKVIGEDELLA